MRIRPSVVLVLFLVLSLMSILPRCRRTASQPVEGSYSPVSESEWNIILILKKGGIAEIHVESWTPGNYDNRSIVKTEGRWRLEENSITVEYNGIKDRLIFEPELSLSVLGYKGGAPGLIQRGPFAKDSILRDYRLWKLPHTFARGKG